MFTALKYSLFKFWLKLLKQFVTYDNIYTNQLKLKVKISKVIVEGNVEKQLKFAICDVTLWRNGVLLKSFNGTNFSWIFNVGFSFFSSKASTVFPQRALLRNPLPITSKLAASNGKWAVSPACLTKWDEWSQPLWSFTCLYNLLAHSQT